MKNQSRLPNMRNLGVILRILIIVNLALAMAAYVLSTDLTDFLMQMAFISTLAQPILLVSILTLYAADTT